MEPTAPASRGSIDSFWPPAGGARAGQNEDPDALDDPPEVKEIMEELGEDPSRGRRGMAAAAGGPFGGGALPRGGPLGVVSTLATGVVALSTQALVWAGDVGDRVLFNSPLGAPL